MMRNTAARSRWPAHRKQGCPFITMAAFFTANRQSSSLPTITTTSHSIHSATAHPLRKSSNRSRLRIRFRDGKDWMINPSIPQIVHGRKITQPYATQTKRPPCRPKNTTRPPCVSVSNERTSQRLRRLTINRCGTRT